MIAFLKIFFITYLMNLRRDHVQVIFLLFQRFFLGGCMEVCFEGKYWVQLVFYTLHFLFRYQLKYLVKKYFLELQQIVHINFFIICVSNKYYPILVEMYIIIYHRLD